MPATILVGAQWGDEGKGRVADWLAADADMVGRYAGGDNAGHTVQVDDRVYKLHLVPSGILHERVMCVLGNGMVINPVNLVREIDELIAAGVPVTPERLSISTRAHIITPAHIALDKASERSRGNEAIGTTLRGIGPAYVDKVGRRGVRAGDMSRPDEFASALTAHIEAHNRDLVNLDAEPLDPQEWVPAYREAAERLRPFLRDTSAYINQRLADGARLVCEGAQGALLDIDHGDYPFVTSSSSTVGGALTGLGFGPAHVDRVVGVAKSFATRVGAGPMPTEVHGALAERLRGTGQNFWDEYGTTTGRPRRCGWLDLVLLRYTARLNGFTELVLTKLDVLSGLDELFIAHAYEIDGSMTDQPPATLAEFQRARPIYERMEGWHDDVRSARKRGDLPHQLLAYIDRVAELCETPISMISVGPQREQLVFF
ncbi:MAG: adenylosuccinate synthase [Candidatus Flexifilum sp.]